MLRDQPKLSFDQRLMQEALRIHGGSAVLEGRQSSIASNGKHHPGFGHPG